MSKDDIVRPPLPQQDPIREDSAPEDPVDFGKRRRDQELNRLYADLLSKARSGTVDGVAMGEFASKFSAIYREKRVADDGPAIDDVSKRALEAIADCTARLATLLPEANAGVAGTLAGALRTLAQVRQLLENPATASTGALYGVGVAPIGGY